MTNNNNKLKVAFFGTSNRSIKILEALNNNFDLQLCITKEDVKVGRKQELKETQVKAWAKQNKVNFVTISDLKSINKEKVIQELMSNKIDLGIVADFSFMIPQKIIDTPKYGLINIHFSLLPKYRGASPVQFSILNADDITGVTYYLMDKGMDTGKIIYQFEHKMTKKETSGQLYKVLFEKAAQELPNTINKYVKGNLIPYEQEEINATYTKSKTNSKHTFIYKEDAKINWNLNAEQIEASIRAFDPWPISWTSLKELADALNLQLKDKFKNSTLKVKIYDASVQGSADPKTNLKINKLQVEGKKVFNWTDFENGYLK